jgi:thioredoxin
MTLREITDATFESVVMGASVPILLDLYADWCQPCKQMTPALERVASKYAGQLEVLKLNVETSPMVAQAFRVQSIPMLVVMNQGRPVDQHMGLLDEAGIEKLVEPFVGPPAGDDASSELGPEELAALIETNRVVPVDIRDEFSYKRCRLVGAIHVEADSLSEAADLLLPSDGRVRVLYARSTDAAQESAERLKEQGIQVAFLKGGILHWQADGFEVERG